MVLDAFAKVVSQADTRGEYLSENQVNALIAFVKDGIDTPIALMRGILGSLSFLNLAGRIQPNQRESLPKRISFGMPYRT